MFRSLHYYQYHTVEEAFQIISSLLCTQIVVPTVCSAAAIINKSYFEHRKGNELKTLRCDRNNGCVEYHLIFIVVVLELVTLHYLTFG